MMLVGLLIIVEDGFPAIFVQERYGIDKKIFKLLKIRTMKNNTAQIGTHEIKNESILSIGRLIRKLKLDEFLQLINVLKGDLNLVGPRPSLITQTDLMKERDKLDIYQIKPGITGLSQVCGYDMSNPRALANVDSLYLHNQSFILDTKILIATVTGIFKKSLKRQFNI